MVVLFTDELDAAKRVNQLCEEFEIPPKNPEISAIPDQQYQKRELTSQYKGVTWNRKRTKWCVLLCLGGKRKYGGLYKDELDAAKRVNQLCEELRIPFQNPEVSATPQYQNKKNKSQYKGISYDKKTCKWNVLIYQKGQKQKYGGYFNDELDAAKRVNQLCEELRIPFQNPEVSATPQYQKKGKTSQYKGVYWHRKMKMWYARVYWKGNIPKYGGIFKNELNAAKRVK